MLKGKTIYLRLLSQDDLLDRVSWINDEENIKTLLFDWPTSIEKTQKWFSNVVFDNSKLNLSIVDKETDELIGMTGLLNIDRINHHAQAYLPIGNKKYRGSISAGVRVWFYRAGAEEDLCVYAAEQRSRETCL